MSSTLKRIFTIGATLTIVGSFLPWQLSGDFVPFWTCGITLHPFVKDSGGFLVVLFTTLVIVMIYRPPEFVKRPSTWSVVFSLLLDFSMLVSYFGSVRD